jgi:hypothetical protein
MPKQNQTSERNVARRNLLIAGAAIAAGIGIHPDRAYRIGVNSDWYFYRWLGALVLAGFTLFATFVANRFWEIPRSERFMVENSFFEHLGLVGGFLLVAWCDLIERRTDRVRN